MPYWDMGYDSNSVAGQQAIRQLNRNDSYMAQPKSLFGRGGQMLYGSKYLSAQPTLLDSAAADYDAQRAAEQRATQLDTLQQQRQLMAQPDLQQQYQLAQIQAQRSAAAQGGTGANRGLAALRAPGIGQQQSVTARQQSISQGLQGLRGNTAAYGAVGGADLAQRQMAYQQAAANQQALLRANDVNAGLSEKAAADEQKNAGRFLQTFASLGAGGMGGMAGGAGYANMAGSMYDE